MWALPRSGEGRWSIAQRPPKRRGKSAASLSSGGMTGPLRRTSVKSRGHGQRDERTPPAVGRVGDRPVLELRQPREARILAAPDLLGVALRARAREQRLGSNRQSDDAVARCGRPRRCEMPRRSSTRTQQDGLVADPGGARVEDRVGAVGEVRAVMSGLAGWRRNRSSWSSRIGIHRASPRACGTASARCRSRRGRRCGACASQRAHVLQRGQPHERRLGALVGVHAVGSRPSWQPPVAGIATGSADVVGAQEPAVGALRRLAVARLAGDTASAASQARISAVASIGCWSNWPRGPPRGHQPSLPTGEKTPSCAGLDRDQPVQGRRDRGVRAGRRPAARPATMSARGSSAFS